MKEFSLPTYRGGANALSLVEAQAVFKAGAVASDTEWRGTTSAIRTVPWLNYPGVWLRVFRAKGRASGHNSGPYTASNPGIYCCAQMAAQVEHQCPMHIDRRDCPECLIDSNPIVGYRIMVHDGDSSGVPINNCPWCGAQLRSIADRPL